MRKLTVIIPHLSYGGAEKVTFNLIQNLLKHKDIDLEILLLKLDANCEQDTNEKLKQLGENVRIYITNSTKISYSLIYLFRYLYANRNRHILTVLNRVNIAALLCGLFMNLKIYITVHDNFRNELQLNPSLKNKIIDICIRLLYRRASRIIAVSDGIKHSLISNYSIPKSKIVRIYNPVLTDLYKKDVNPVQHDWIKNNDIKVILAVGSLRIQKNFYLLIQSFKLVLSKRNDVRLIILGEGPLRERLQSLIKDLGIENYVDLYGYVSNPLSFMYHSDVFVLSSDTEALPTVLIEALSVGMKVVSTNCLYGPKEILKDGKFGKLTPVGDAVALAEAIVEVLSGKCFAKPDLSKYSLNFATDKYIETIFGNEKN